MPHTKKRYSFTSMDQLYDICRQLGCAQLGEDNDGQLVIYTGLTMVGLTDTNRSVVEEMED